MNLATRLSSIIVLLVSSFVLYLLAFHYVRIGGMLSAITFWSAVWLMIPKKFFNMVWREIKKQDLLDFCIYLYDVSCTSLRSVL